jgi:26S proteasome regulatory subunit N2
MPKTEFRCNARPSLFAYPPPLEEKKRDENEKVETAVLSITNKKKLQQSKRSHDKNKDAAPKPSTNKKSVKEDEKMEVDEPGTTVKKEEAPKTEEK